MSQHVNETIEQNKSQGEEYRLACSRCHVETRHLVLQSVEVSGTVDDWFDYWEKHQLVQCRGCNSMSYRKFYGDSENTFWDEEHEMEVPIKHEELYPSRVAGRHKLWRAPLLPSEISRIYNETHAALCNKQPVLAGIGIRALVETVCKEKGTTKYELVSKVVEIR